VCSCTMKMLVLWLGNANAYCEVQKLNSMSCLPTWNVGYFEKTYVFEVRIAIRLASLLFIKAQGKLRMPTAFE